MCTMTERTREEGGEGGYLKKKKVSERDLKIICGLQFPREAHLQLDFCNRLTWQYDRIM